MRASSSRPISLYRRISRMALAWFSENLSCWAMIPDSLDLKRIPSVFPSTRQAFAIARSLEPRRISMIKSMTLQAFIRPSCISLLLFSLARRFSYFLVVVSYWKSTLAFMISFSPRVSGLPSTMASIFTPNVSSSLVFLYSMLIKLSTSASLRSSMTIRMPSLEDWLEISLISCVFFVSARDATSERNFPI